MSRLQHLYQKGYSSRDLPNASQAWWWTAINRFLDLQGKCAHALIGCRIAWRRYSNTCIMRGVKRKRRSCSRLKDNWCKQLQREVHNLKSKRRERLNNRSKILRGRSSKKALKDRSTFWSRHISLCKLGARPHTWPR